MSEPTYTYVRGEGWTPRYHKIITMQDGRNAYLEYRRPEKGEYFTWCWKGEWDEKQWNLWLGRQECSWLSKYDGNEGIPERTDCVVVVIIDE